MSTRKPIEVLVRADRPRSWTAEQKRDIVAESLSPEQTAADVARKHGISLACWFAWTPMSMAGRCGGFWARWPSLDRAAVRRSGLYRLRCHGYAQGDGWPAMLVQQGLGTDPFDGAVHAFRGRRAGLIKLIWLDGIGLCMLSKRLEQGQFAWPSATSTGRMALSAAQLAALLDGCEWRAPVARARPELAG